MGKKKKIHITIPTIIFWLSTILNQRSLVPIIPFCAAVLHECGHLCSMKLCGKKIETITLFPFGIDIKSRGEITSYKADILICISGIAVNLLLAIICAFLPKNTYTEMFFSSNLIFAIINSLPIKTLDGGELIEKMLYVKTDPYVTERICSALSFFAILLLGSFAIWLFFKSGYNFTLLFMCIFLFGNIFLK